MTWSKDPNRRRGQPPTQVARIMARHHHTCHVCGHGDADQCDHIINVARWLREGLQGSPHRDTNLAPIHGTHCPTCGARCHTDKTQREAQAGMAVRPTARRPIEQHPGRARPHGAGSPLV